jgi:hypothetical protein
MGLAYNTYLNSNRIYGCKGCKTHLANHDDILSRVNHNQSLLSAPSVPELGLLLPLSLSLLRLASPTTK